MSFSKDNFNKTKIALIWKDEKIDSHLSIYLIDCIFAYFVKMTNVTPGMIQIDPTYDLH